jgi:hypothetical protein
VGNFGSTGASEDELREHFRVMGCEVVSLRYAWRAVSVLLPLGLTRVQHERPRLCFCRVCVGA